MKKLKILVSAFAFDPREPSSISYSAGYIGWRLVEQISRFSDVCVLTTQDNRDAILESLSEGALSGVSIHFVNIPSDCSQVKLSPYSKFRCARNWNRRALEYAQKLHAEKKFDAAHHLSLGPSWLPNLLGASLALPFIWGPMGGEAGWLKNDRKEHSQKHFIRKKWERITLRKGTHSGQLLKCAESAKAILVGNPDLALSFAGLDRRKIHVFPAYGIETEVNAPREKTPANQDKFKVISAGSTHPEHGFSLAAEAFLLFNRESPNSEYVFFTDELGRKDIERIFRTGIDRHRIQIHSQVVRAEMREKLRRGNVFVNLAQGEEAEAWLIEAMAAGLPAVTVPGGRAGFLLQDNWGIKVKLEGRERMVLAIAAALGKLYSDSRGRKKMARAALRNAGNYTWARMGKKLQGIYGEAFLQDEDVRFSGKGKERFCY